MLLIKTCATKRMTTWQCARRRKAVMAPGALQLLLDVLEYVLIVWVYHFVLALQQMNFGHMITCHGYKQNVVT